MRFSTGAFNLRHDCDAPKAARLPRVIHCYGKLEGEAQLILMLNGAPYKTERMKGKVIIDWGGDWYSDSMELRYQPSSITSGQLVIEYTFTDL